MEGLRPRNTTQYDQTLIKIASSPKNHKNVL
jgi:hypothetical protein